MLCSFLVSKEMHWISHVQFVFYKTIQVVLQVHALRVLPPVAASEVCVLNIQPVGGWGQEVLPGGAHHHC